MKKIILFALLAVISVNAFAQKGRHAVGISIEELGMITFGSDYDAYKNSFGITAKYQYGISDYFTIEPSFTYYITSKNKVEDHSEEGFEPKYSAGVALHAFFTKTSRLRPYAIAGVSYLHSEDLYYDTFYDDFETDKKNNDFNAKIGLGLDYRITYNWNLQLEACYTTAYKAEAIGIGCTYNF